MAKDELHHLVDALPEKATPAVKRILESILRKASIEDKDWLPLTTLFGANLGIENGGE